VGPCVGDHCPQVARPQPRVQAAREQVGEGVVRLAVQRPVQRDAGHRAVAAQPHRDRAARAAGACTLSTTTRRPERGHRGRSRAPGRGPGRRAGPTPPGRPPRRPAAHQRRTAPPRRPPRPCTRRPRRPGPPAGPGRRSPRPRRSPWRPSPRPRVPRVERCAARAPRGRGPGPAPRPRQRPRAHWSRRARACPLRERSTARRSRRTTSATPEPAARRPGGWRVRPGRAAARARACGAAVPGRRRGPGPRGTPPRRAPPRRPQGARSPGVRAPCAQPAPRPAGGRRTAPGCRRGRSSRACGRSGRRAPRARPTPEGGSPRAQAARRPAHRRQRAGRPARPRPGRTRSEERAAGGRRRSATGPCPTTLGMPRGGDKGSPGSVDEGPACGRIGARPARSCESPVSRASRPAPRRPVPAGM
jgi:hypothetical protein